MHRSQGQANEGSEGEGREKRRTVPEVQEKECVKKRNTNAKTKERGYQIVRTDGRCKSEGWKNEREDDTAVAQTALKMRKEHRKTPARQNTERKGARESKREKKRVCRRKKGRERREERERG